LEAFTQLQKEGKIKYFGGSHFYTYRIMEYLHLAEKHDYIPISCLQNRFTYARRNSAAEDSSDAHATREVQRCCAAKNIPNMAFSALAQGAYTNPNKKIRGIYVSEDTELRVAKLHELAKKHNVSANQLVLRWMAEKKDCTIIPLFSASNLQQIEENLGAETIEFTQEMFEELDKAGVSPK